MQKIYFQRITESTHIKVLDIKEEDFEVRQGRVRFGRVRCGGVGSSVVGCGEGFIPPPEYKRTLPVGKNQTKQGGINGKIKSKDYRRITFIDAQHRISGRSKSNGKSIQGIVEEAEQNR